MSRQRRSELGFTLVELLTVLVIIGLMSSAVVLSLPQDKPGIYTETDKLTQQLNLAAQESIITGKPHAWGISGTQYAFFRYEEAEWVSLATTDLNPDLRYELTRQSTKVEPVEGVLPLIIFEPTGMATPFSLKIEGPERLVTLEGTGSGPIKRLEASR